MPEYLQTGIEGLDEVLNGGIHRNSSILVSGSPGTGKTLLGMQYVYNGVHQFDEDGIFLSFEETMTDLQRSAEAIGLTEWGRYVDEGHIKVLDKRITLSDDFRESFQEFLLDVQEADYQRLVLDSLSTLELFFEDEFARRRYILKFLDVVKSHGLTSVLTNEQAAVIPETDLSKLNYLTDGNIYLRQSPLGDEHSRQLWVSKMRRQDVEKDLFELRIDDTGLSVSTAPVATEDSS